MKTILIDASLAYKNDGTGRVSYNLTPEIIKQDNGKNEFIILEYNQDIFHEITNAKKIISKFSGKGQIRSLWYLFYLPYLLFKYKVDIFYSFEGFSTPLIFAGKTILTIHDLIPIKVKKYYRKFLNRTWFNFRVYLSTRSQHEVITVSQYSKSEIEIYFPIFKNHIHVVYNALDKRFNQINADNELINKENLSLKKFLLCVGGMEKRKNNILAINSFINLVKSDKHFQMDLVIVGVGGESYKNSSVEGFIEIPEKFKRRIHFIPTVTNNELISLFQNAFAFLFPSTYEGFGMPLLEAMHLNVPVIALNSSSIPEVAGDAAILVNNNVEDMSKAIKSLISNNELYKSFVAKGVNQCAKFSWEKEAQKISKIIENIP